MSEPENFLARWSARKLANRTQAAEGNTPAQPRPGDEADAAEDSAPAETRKDDTPEHQAFDPTQLPPVESIGPDTDIAAFLRRDVPPELTRAALRRAWTSDPAIKDFVGLVETGWDFNDPTAMPGFGPISPEEVARLAGKVFAALPDAAPQDQAKNVSSGEQPSRLASSSAAPAEHFEAAANPAEPGCDSSNDATQQNETGNEG